MKYGIYFTRSNSSDNYKTSANGWYTEVPYNTVKAAKAALEGIACMLNDDCYKCSYKDRLTLVGERKDNLQQPTTDRVVYNICVYDY